MSSVIASGTGVVIGVPTTARVEVTSVVSDGVGSTVEGSTGSGDLASAWVVSAAEDIAEVGGEE